LGTKRGLTGKQKVYWLFSTNLYLKFWLTDIEDWEFK